MRARGLWVLVLLAACATGPKYKDDAAVAARADTKALGIKTTVEAKTVTLVLAARWNADIKLNGEHVGMPSAGVTRARGKAVLDLRELHIEADEIEVRFIDDEGHEDILLHARNVKRFYQHIQYGHRTENADLVTMANSHVNIFKQ